MTPSRYENSPPLAISLELGSIYSAVNYVLSQLVVQYPEQVACRLEDKRAVLAAPMYRGIFLARDILEELNPTAVDILEVDDGVRITQQYPSLAIKPESTVGFGDAPGSIHFDVKHDNGTRAPKGVRYSIERVPPEITDTDHPHPAHHGAAMYNVQRQVIPAELPSVSDGAIEQPDLFDIQLRALASIADTLRLVHPSEVEVLSVTKIQE